MSRRIVGAYSDKFKCLVDNPCMGCKWFEEYAPPFVLGELIFIGWCGRYKPDPDAGYIFLGKNPPCLVWGYEVKQE